MSELAAAYLFLKIVERREGFPLRYGGWLDDSYFTAAIGSEFSRGDILSEALNHGFEPPQQGSGDE